MFFFSLPTFCLILCCDNIYVMDIFFDYSKTASGKNFVGRKNDVNYISNMISQGESVALYGEPHAGRSTVVNQALTLAQMSGKGISVVKVDLLNCRTNEAVLSRFAVDVLSLCAPSLDEVMDVHSTYLEGSAVRFDEEAYMCDAPYISFDAPADAETCRRILALPYDLAERRNLRVCVIFEHFQNANADSRADILLKSFESIVAARKGRCSMVFMGDRFNATKEIFEVKRYFWKDVVIYPLSELSEIEAGEYVLRSFQSKGKVIDRAIFQNVVRALRVNMWYINLFFSTMDYISIGYATQKNCDETWELLLCRLRARFISQIADLTDYQITLLKAVIDGETRLSSVGVVEKYGLNSSANVKRLKDALMKKEVLWFDDRDVPHIQDILFEIWLRKEYFA